MCGPSDSISLARRAAGEHVTTHDNSKCISDIPYHFRFAAVALRYLPEQAILPAMQEKDSMKPTSGLWLPLAILANPGLPKMALAQVEPKPGGWKTSVLTSSSQLSTRLNLGKRDGLNQMPKRDVHAGLGLPLPASLRPLETELILRNRTKGD
jgi:hypothetical protein